MNPSLPNFHDLYQLLRPSCLPTRTGALMIAASLPSILCTLVMTLPGVIFTNHGDNAYVHFSRILTFDKVSYLPITLTATCLGCALLLPLNPKRAALARYLRDD